MPPYRLAVKRRPDHDFLPRNLKKKTGILDCYLHPLKLTAKAPENGWLEYDPFLLGFGLFSGATKSLHGAYTNGVDMPILSKRYTFLWFTS